MSLSYASRRALLGSPSAGGAPIVLPDADLGYIQVGDSRSAFGLGVSGGATYTMVNDNQAACWGKVQQNMASRILRGAGPNFAQSSRSPYGTLNAITSNSRAATGNPAVTTGDAYGVSTSYNTAGDDPFWTLAEGYFSPIDHPSMIVFYFPEGVNSTGARYTSDTTGVLAALMDIKRTVAAFVAAGKVVMLGNEIPKGYNTKYMEAKTFVSGLATATNTTGFVDGESFPTPGNGLISPLGVSYTKVTTLAGAGEYTVNSSGQYRVHSTDPMYNATGYIGVYSYNPAATDNRHLAIHQWLSSSDAAYVGQITGFDLGFSYGIPGALYGQTMVFPVNTWDAVYDPSSGTNYYGYAGYHLDQVHGTQTLAVAIRAACLAALALAYPARTTSIAQITNKNNFKALTFTGVGPHTTGALVGDMAALASQANISQLTMRLVSPTVNYSYRFVDDGNGTTATLTGNDTASQNQLAAANYKFTYSTKQCVFTLVSNLGTNRECHMEADPTNILRNSTFDTAQGTTALPTNVTGSATPQDWVITLNTGLTNALVIGNRAAGGIDIDVSYTTDGDGVRWLVLKVWGKPTASGAALTLGLNYTYVYANMRLPATASDATTAKWRITAKCEVRKGPGGHLFGLTHTSLASTNSNSAAFTRPINGSITACRAEVGGSGANQPFCDQVIGLEGGTVHAFEMVSDIQSTLDMSGNSQIAPTFVLSFNQGANVPIDCEVRVALPQQRVRTT
jgi:hypothetical protein